MPSFRGPGAAVVLRDVIVVATIVLFAITPFPDQTFRATGPLVVLALFPAGAVAFRRVRPLTVLCVSVACAVILAIGGVISPSALLAAAFAAFSVADRRGRLIGASAVGAAAAIVFVSNGLALDGDYFDATTLQFVLLIILGGALGDAARSRRSFQLAMIERAATAERAADDAARRRISEERVRIARDLHDVVAHQIAVISLNAGVASSALASDPERARRALGAIRRSSRTVLGDTGRLMALLRSDDPSREGHTPAGSLDDLDALVAGFARTGLKVDVAGADRATVLSPASDHVVFRVLQEALTNAHKHGDRDDRRVAVDFAVAAEALTMRVRTAVSPGQDRADGGGHGMLGIRERVQAIGGRVSVHEGSSSHVLEIRVPVDGERGQEQ